MVKTRKRSYSSHGSRSRVPPTPATPAGRGRQQSRSTSSRRSNSGSNVSMRSVRFGSSAGGSRRSTASRGSSSSKSSGKLGGGRSVRSASRALSRVQNTGVLFTSEVGISTSSGPTDSLMLGHTTFPRYIFLSQMFRVIIKNFFRLNRIHIHSFVDVAPLKVDDEIWLNYKSDYDTGTTVSSKTYTFVAGNSFETIVAYFVAEMFASDPMTHFIEMKFVSKDGANLPVYLPLQGARIRFTSRSDLKMQNQTSVGTDDDADDVDNVPLDGKSYEGVGTGSNSFKNRAIEQQFVCDDATGVFTKVGTVAGGLAEAPPPGYFRNVKKVGKIHLDPGQLKTSTLVTKKSLLLEDFCRHIFTSGSVDSYMTRFGKFRFFHLEHMLKAKSSAPLINVAGEVNLRVSMTLSCKQSYITDERMTVTYVTY